MNDTLVFVAIVVILICGFRLYFGRETRQRERGHKARWPKGATIRWQDPEYGFRRGDIGKHVFFEDGTLSGFWVETIKLPRNGYATYTKIFVPMSPSVSMPVTQTSRIEEATPMAELLDSEEDDSSVEGEVEENNNFWRMIAEGDKDT